MAFDAVVLHPLNSAGSTPASHLALQLRRRRRQAPGVLGRSLPRLIPGPYRRVATIVSALYPHLPVVVFAGAPAFLHVHDQLLVRHRSSSFRSTRQGN